MSRTTTARLARRTQEAKRRASRERTKARPFTLAMGAAFTLAGLGMAALTIAAGLEVGGTVDAAEAAYTLGMGSLMACSLLGVGFASLLAARP